MGGRAIAARVNTKDVAKDLGRFGPDAAKRLAKLEDSLTAQVMRAAHARAARVGRQQSRAASTLRRPAKGAGAVLPGQPAWNAGAEFGSMRYPQFPRYRGNGAKAGYFLFPALSEVNMLAQSSELVSKLCKEFDNG